jgi:hypothetical protein
LKKGDQNTRFFHHLANSHRRNNFISGLSIDGLDTSNQEVINDTIIQFYMNLLTEMTIWWPKLDGLELLLSMDGDKASGPDGFTIAVFQLCWVIV